MVCSTTLFSTLFTALSLTATAGAYRSDAARHRRHRINQSSSDTHLSSKRTTVTLPAGWSYSGCYQDPNAPRLLSTRISSSSSNTQQSCVSQCSASGYTYAGVEFGQECWCGSSLNSPQTAPSTSCNMACAGDSTQVCGAGNIIGLFSYAPTGYSGSAWTSLGCYQDQSARTLSGPTTTSSSMTPAVCQAFCVGYAYSGVEDHNQCFCGNSLTVNKTLAATNCQATCSGDATQYCGGTNWQVALYHSSTTTGTSTSTSTTTTTTTSTTSASTTTTTTTTALSTPTPTPTGGWASLGCYQDQAARTLNGPSTSSSSMTPAVCQAFCKGYSYAGTENSQECYCGNSLTVNSTLPSTSCQNACSGDATKICGGWNWDLSLYQLVSLSSTTTTSTSTTTTTTSMTTTSTPAPTGGWISQGCYQDQAARTLNGASTSSSSMTPAICQAFCKGYSYAGTENSQECYCGNSLTVNSTLLSSSCQNACSGDVTQVCGGWNWALSLYKLSSSTTTTTTTTTATTTTTSTPTPTGGWTSLGCYQDAPARTLNGTSKSTTSMTPALCQTFCMTAGYVYAGTENSQECYCGNGLALNTTLPSSSCQSTCDGDTTQICGGGNWALSLYKLASNTTTSATTTTTTSSSPTSTGWTSLGCYQDQTVRTLSGPSTTSSSMTPAVCQAYCATGGYGYSGLENAQECYCGNSLTVNSTLAASNCQSKCAGDATQLCGGSNWDLSLYRSTNASTIVTQSGPLYNSVGCFVDSPSRVLTTMAPAGQYTLATCATYCAASGFAYLGLESGIECHCGSAMQYSQAGGVQANAPTDCAEACLGDPTGKTMCGGSWRLMVYYDAALDSGGCKAV